MVMESSLTFGSVAALFGVMVIGALVPSVSVLAVSTRSATFGFMHGIFTTLGIAAGDIIFILIALFGLSVLAEKMGDQFVLIKYLGGTYLIWLGIALWRAKTGAMREEDVQQASLLSSFMTGLLITLADQKAILFYLGFLPAFIDLSSVSYLDAGIILLIAVTAISTKLLYAFMADRARRLFTSSAAMKGINKMAGSVMIGVGIFLMGKA